MGMGMVMGMGRSDEMVTEHAAGLGRTMLYAPILNLQTRYRVRLTTQPFTTTNMAHTTTQARKIACQYRICHISLPFVDITPPVHIAAPPHSAPYYSIPFRDRIKATARRTSDCNRDSDLAVRPHSMHAELSIKSRNVLASGCQR